MPSLVGCKQHYGFAHAHMLERFERNEGIVFGLYYECWNANLTEERAGTGPFVIVIGVAKSIKGPDNHVVDLAHAQGAPGRRQVVAVWMEFLPLFVAAMERQQKVPLIEPVFRPVERVGADTQI